MRAKTPLMSFAAALCLLLALAGCATAAAGADTPESLNLECFAAYRGSVTVPIEREETVRLSADLPEQALAFADLTFHARYWPVGSPGGEHGLRLWVTLDGGEEALVSQLFQFSEAEAVRNQFVGGHGFSGLSYTYHPESGAELQYSCAVVE